MAARNSPSAGQNPRSIIATRGFDAPRELVFEAWTDPKHLVQWWGPTGFTTTVRTIDVRPGGVWRFVMHGPDGVDYENRIVYEEIVKPERLVYSHPGDDDVEPVQIHVTVTFEDHGGKTKLTMLMLSPRLRNATGCPNSMTPSRVQNNPWNVSRNIWRRWANRRFTCNN
jgi:uncharacterized protein YndB with AHSA1/START domain